MSMKHCATALLLFALTAMVMVATAAEPATHSFSSGEKVFLLGGASLKIRWGEIRAARVPRDYWRPRLQFCRARGLNGVCVFLFGNRHEFEQGKYDWSGEADTAE